MGFFDNEIVIDMRRGKRNKRKSNNGTDKVTAGDIFSELELARINNAIVAVYHVCGKNVLDGMDIEEAMYQGLYLIESVVGFTFEEPDSEAILENLELYLIEVSKTKN